MQTIQHPAVRRLQVAYGHLRAAERWHGDDADAVYAAKLGVHEAKFQLAVLELAEGLVEAWTAIGMPDRHREVWRQVFAEDFGVVIADDGAVSLGPNAITLKGDVEGLIASSQVSRRVPA